MWSPATAQPQTLWSRLATGAVPVVGPGTWFKHPRGAVSAALRCFVALLWLKIWSSASHLFYFVPRVKSCRSKADATDLLIMNSRCLGWELWCVEISLGSNQQSLFFTCLYGSKKIFKNTVGEKLFPLHSFWWVFLLDSSKLVSTFNQKNKTGIWELLTVTL